MTSISKKLIFELSGEHPRLPFIELQSVLNTIHKSKYDLESTKCTQLIQVELYDFSDDIYDKLSRRLAMCKSIHQLIIRSEISNYGLKPEIIRNLDLPQNTTFKLRTRRKGFIDIVKKEKINEIKSEIIKRISKYIKVNVTTPDIEFFLFYGPEIIITKKVQNIDRSSFEHRRPQFRPFFAPISLHPRLARCLVNLGVTTEQGLVLDPFCGTGGFLIEAGLMGYSVIGADIEINMVNGIKTNLLHFKINDFTIIHAGIDDLLEKLDSKLKINAIITEPPYGRSTTTSGETLESIMKRSFKVFHEILPKGGRLVISLPDVDLINYAENYFIKQEIFKIRIHRSLTKYVIIFERD
jgi:tRNA (guanine10-N2)-dimethyltransferase